jgi:hypothetical protein
VKGPGLAEVLKDLQAVLTEEASAAPGEDLLGRKEAAVAKLETLLHSGVSLNGMDDAIALQLRDLLAANRLSLKWNGLRAQLGRLSQPKDATVSAQATRPRLDLVH